MPWSDRLSYDIAYREQELLNNEEAATNEVLPSVTTTASSSKYTKSWLEDCLRSVLRSRDDKAKLGQQEFCNFVFDILVSSQSDDEMQSSLCDMIGYDHLDLIIELIENRSLIVDGIVKNAKPRPSVIIRAPERIERESRPIHGPTIVVKSEEEIRLEKQIQKQYRKSQQQQSQQQASDNVLDDFANPELLRYERERQLLVATERRYEKLSNLSQSSSTRTTIKYPFVFDQLLEVKQKTAYIGGRDLLLPENVERKSTTTYDLVHLPHGEQIKLANLGKNICSELVRYEDLEPLGQILFKDSIKTLNLVQSIVYKAAAFSNQNLLISAP